MGGGPQQLRSTVVSVPASAREVGRRVSLSPGGERRIGKGSVKGECAGGPFSAVFFLFFVRKSSRRIGMSPGGPEQVACVWCSCRHVFDVLVSSVPCQLKLRGKHVSWLPKCDRSVIFFSVKAGLRLDSPPSLLLFRGSFDPRVLVVVKFKSSFVPGLTAGYSM